MAIKINQKLRSWILPEGAQTTSVSLAFWRYELFFLISVIYLAGGVIAGSIAIPAYLLEGYNNLIPVITITLIVLFMTIFARNLNFKFRCFLMVFVIYLLGIVFLNELGVQGLGLTFLFGFSILTSVLLGLTPGFYALGLNALTLTTMNLILLYFPQTRASVSGYSPIFWVAVSVTFLLLNALVMFTVGMIINQLNKILESETQLRKRLEKEIEHKATLEFALKAEQLSLKDKVEARTAQLKSANEKLSTSMQYKDMFLANVSHELRTPIHAINGYLELLEKQTIGILSEKQKGYIDRISYSCHHLLKVVNEILDITRIQAGKLVLRKQLIALEESCENALSVVRVQAEQKEISITVSIQKEIKTLYADPLRFNQILINLLSNAVKFTPVKGMAGIDIQMQDEAILMKIWDTGIGIPEEEIGRLFSPFYRTDKSKSEDVQGAGLGLSIVRSLIEAHDWQLEMESQENKGTVFSVIIPDQKQTGDA